MGDTEIPMDRIVPMHEKHAEETRTPSLSPFTLDNKLVEAINSGRRPDFTTARQMHAFYISLHLFQTSTHTYRKGSALPGQAWRNCKISTRPVSGISHAALQR